MKRPIGNHFGRCSQMLVDGCHRPLDDTSCISCITVHGCAHGVCKTPKKKHFWGVYFCVMHSASAEVYRNLRRVDANASQLIAMHNKKGYDFIGNACKITICRPILGRTNLYLTVRMLTNPYCRGQQL